ncbi:MAG: UDP-3-O-(3-hydroxymyristoyl)glucosamine N-acyltransferase [Armatimonadetes bacterium]|nr:UDP-3-O-(3-hydroxymyristoyl)glucosamine N-acyltransferase [Armatimonadota bacterium]
MTVSLQQIADLVSGQLFGDPQTTVSGVSSIAEAGPGDLVFAESRRHVHEAESSAAAAVLTRHEPESGAKPAVVVSDPRTAFAAVLEWFAPKITGEPGVDPTARVHESAQLGENVSIGYNTFVGADVQIGAGVVILPFCYIGDGVRIGENTVINPHVTIYPTCRIGSRVIIHSGAVIGADGFGFNQVEGTHQKIPHIGSVLIHDDVEIGANVTIDRSRTGSTEIGEGTKIDNLVHVAHNVKVGRNCIIVAQVGISGSVVVGDNVILAGQAGVKDHVTIGDGAQVAARAGIIADVSKGSRIAGFPARSYGDQMRIWASLPNLPKLIKQVQALESRVNELQAQLAIGEASCYSEERVAE